MSYDYYLNKYNIKSIDFEELLDFQGGLCPICGEYLDLNSKNKSDIPCLDHDHISGEVRGILHSRCNLALGLLRDNVKAAQNAACYLQEPPSRIFFSNQEIPLDEDF